MQSDDKSSLEILSKLVIQLKTEQKEIVKTLRSEMDEIKENNIANIKRLKEAHEAQIQSLANEIKQLQTKLDQSQEKNSEILLSNQNKLEKTDKELRDDMLKLLKKYESKFQIQDDEIENLKDKCEINKCPNCNFESFRVHFKECTQCNCRICLTCMKDCKKCEIVNCTKCQKQCNTCLEGFCYDEMQKCVKQCDLCMEYFCEKCNQNCKSCNRNYCGQCLKECRICLNHLCKDCCELCQKCSKPIICKACFFKNSPCEKCTCGKTLCLDCEDECNECNIPFTWSNGSRIFQGFHIRSLDYLPNKCIIKILIKNKGIDTTHIGLTIDTEFASEEKATENFWSLCLNTGEKFSTSEYKKKGSPWGKYALPVKTGDYVYLRFNEGEVRFYINRKDYNKAFLLDKSFKYYLYSLTHADSTNVEIRSMKILQG